MAAREGMRPFEYQGIMHPTPNCLARENKTVKKVSAPLWYRLRPWLKEIMDPVGTSKLGMFWVGPLRSPTQVFLQARDLRKAAQTRVMIAIRYVQSQYLVTFLD